MIYFVCGEQAVLIVEPTNIDRLVSGKPMITLDRKFMVLYTPDMKFTETQLMDMLLSGTVDPEKLDQVMKESLKREKVRR